MSTLGSSNKVTSNPDLIQYCGSYLNLAELGGACQVSRIWKTTIDGLQGQHLWKELSIKEGVPLVQGEDRNYKEDFRFLLPITLSGRVIGKYLGEVVGGVPPMNKGRFEELRDSIDYQTLSYSPKTKVGMRDTHVVVVDPSVLKITVSPKRPLTLNASGTLVEVPVNERSGIVPVELNIPFSLKNLIMLATYPLEKKGDGPVFGKSSSASVTPQCDLSPKQNSVLIMSKEAIYSNNTVFQSGTAIEHGFKVMTIRQRGFYDAIAILKTGKCPDVQGSYIPKDFAIMSAESSRAPGCNAALKYTDPNVGLNISQTVSSPYNIRGVIFGISAEDPMP